MMISYFLLMLYKCDIDVLAIGYVDVVLMCFTVEYDVTNQHNKATRAGHRVWYFVYVYLHFVCILLILGYPLREIISGSDLYEI